MSNESQDNVLEPRKRSMERKTVVSGHLRIISNHTHKETTSVPRFSYSRFKAKEERVGVHQQTVLRRKRAKTAEAYGKELGSNLASPKAIT